MDLGVVGAEEEVEEGLSWGEACGLWLGCPVAVEVMAPNGMAPDDGDGDTSVVEGQGGDDLSHLFGAAYYCSGGSQRGESEDEDLWKIHFCLEIVRK